MNAANGDRKRARLTVAQALVRYLQAQFSERDGMERRLIPGILGIFGHGNVAGLSQALIEYGHDLRFIQGHNEQSMVHLAAGFAKANQRLATLACTASIGPGSTNMITGAAAATINRLPVLLLPSDYYVTRYQGPVLQQLEHPLEADVSVNDCYRPISRFFDRISRPEQLLTALPEAMRVLTDPAETGSVTICLPQDLQSHAYDFPAHFFEKRVWRVERPLPDPRRIDEAVALLKSASRPVLIAGGGVHYAQAWDDLAGFAQRFGIPVAETFGGKGAMREDAWFLLGGAGAQGTPAAAQVMKDADLVICVGTRLTDFTTGSHSAFANPEVRFIHINVTARDAHKLGALPLVADAREALRALHKAAEAAGVQYGDAYRQEVTEIKERWTSEYQSSLQPGPGEAMNQGQLIRTLNEFARPGDTVVAAAGTPPGDLLKTWDATCGRNCHLEFGYSCMGYEIPGGLGVRLAVAQGLRLGHGGTELQVPEGEVYVYIGDGTYILNPGELVTAVQLGLKVTVVISENHGYQSIYGLQMGTVGHDFGNEFVPEDGHREGGYLKLDLAQSAAGLGACAFHADSPERLRAALEAARQETRPCVIVAETEAHRYLPPSGVWWDVAPAEVSNDAETQQRRADYERDRDTLQRFYY